MTESANRLSAPAGLWIDRDRPVSFRFEGRGYQGDGNGFTARYDQHRQVFDPDRQVTSDRKDWQFGLGVTANSWLRFDGRYGLQSRTGNRLSYPLGSCQEEMMAATRSC